MATSQVTDIRLQLSFFGNRKITRLQRELGPESVLALLRLWCYCAANEPDGHMLGWESTDLESACMWSGVHDAFTMHCVRIGLLDELKGGGYVIHDWEENQPWASASAERSRRNKRAAEIRWERHKTKLEDAECMHDACIAESKCNAPFLSSPSLSLPNKKTRASKPALDGFFEFWEAYPRKVGKGAAEKAWAKIQPDALPGIMKAVQVQRHSPDWKKDDGKFIPNPATWLNQRRWEDEIQAPAQAPQPAYYQPVEIRKNEISPEEECLSLTDVLKTLRNGPESHQERRTTQEP